MLPHVSYIDDKLHFKFIRVKNTVIIINKKMIQGMVKAQYFGQYQAIQVFNQQIIQSKPFSDNIVKVEQISSSNKKLRYQQLQERLAQNRKQQVTDLFQSLLNKYFISVSSEEFEELIQKILKFRSQLMFKTSDDMEIVHAVFYYIYVDYLGFYNTKDFCSRNGLSAKKFNKKYKAYVLYLRRDRNYASQGSQSQSLASKSLNRQQEDADKKDEPEKILTASNTNSKNKAPKIIDFNMSACEAIDLIYDFVFKTEYFQENRRQIILKIAQKCEDTNPKLIEAITWTENSILKIYYIMFYYFRICGAQFSYTDLKEIVYEKLKLKMNREGYVDIFRVFKKFNKEQELILSEK